MIPTANGSSLGHVLSTLLNALPWRRALERWMTATITEVMIKNPAENRRSIGKEQMRNLQQADQQSIPEPRQLKDTRYSSHAGKYGASNRPGIEARRKGKANTKAIAKRLSCLV